jgi:putative oxidoreductase
MDVLTKTVARYVFAIPFLVFGFFHLMGAKDMAPMIPEWLPGGVFWVVLTGFALIAAAVSIFIRILDYYAAFLLGIMLIIFVLVLHLPGALEGDQMSTSNLLKDLGLAAASWLYAGYVAKK